MLRDLWRYITNLGISDQLIPFDEKAVKLLNQVSFVMMLWFFFLTITGLVFIEGFEFLISGANVLLFGGVLVLNSYHLFKLSKHYFLIFGLAMVTFVNLAYPHGAFPLIQFITTAIFPVLIFKKNRTVFIYMVLNVLSFFLVLYFHQNYEPLLASEAYASQSNPAFGVVIVMLIVFLVVLFFRNVGDDTDRKLVEKNRYLNELIHKTQSMQEHLINSEKMASLGQLTAGIAHEINNPINFVSSNVGPLKLDLDEMKELCLRYQSLHESQDLQKDLQKIKAMSDKIDPDFLAEEIDTLMRGIEEGAERTKQIVAGLRSFSRMDEDEFKNTNLHEGIESTLMLLRNKLKDRINVIKDFGNIPAIDCIPGKINQVMMNILNNAAEAIHNEGTLTIRTHLNDRSDKVIISIIDDGPGMSIAVSRRIFDPFYTTKPIGKGTGLGLSISYGIIEKHGGSIEVKSSPNKGSEFIITLPVHQAKKTS